MVIELINLFGKILLMMGFGFVLAKKNIINEEMKRNMSALLVKAILYINILSTAGQTYSQENSKGMFQIIGISVSYYLISLIVFSLLIKRLNTDKNFIGEFINVAVFANVGFIGFPILGELFGQKGTLYTVAYNMSYQLFFFSYGMLLLSKDKKLSIKNLLGNNIIYVSLFSIFLYVSQIRFPEFVQSTLNTVGGMMIPLSMMIIGWEIANIEIGKILKDKYSYIVSFFRLIFFPILLAILLKILKIDNTVATAAVLLTALPSGSLTVIVCEECGGNTEFASKAVAQSTFLMVITLPLIFIMVNYLF